MERHDTSDAWWVRIETQVPRCTYFFGPFFSRDEAATASPGYVEDLCEERALGIVAWFEQGQPSELTIEVA